MFRKFMMEKSSESLNLSLTDFIRITHFSEIQKLEKIPQARKLKYRISLTKV